MKGIRRIVSTALVATILAAGSTPAFGYGAEGWPGGDYRPPHAKKVESGKHKKADAGKSNQGAEDSSKSKNKEASNSDKAGAGSSK
jgi:hypothetical protein